jgi:iron complex outermembrane recepter protein
MRISKITLLLPCLIIAFLFLNLAGANAQNNYSYNPGNAKNVNTKKSGTYLQADEKNEKNKLINVLKELNKVKGVYFMFSSQSMSNKVVNIVDDMNEDVEVILDKILKNTGLTYKKITNNTFVILPVKDVEKSASGIQSIGYSNILSVEAQSNFNAPDDVITGKVVDNEGRPVAGVTVTIKGKSNGTSTNNEGIFNIEAEKGDVLVFTSVGYELQQIVVGTNNNIQVALIEANRQLNEVVVTALGIKREAKSLGYSDQQVKGSDVIKADPPNIAQGLIGKAAGLNVTVPNGVEGSSSRIVIRGNNSLLGNNQPLIVIDGVMVDNEPILPQGQDLSTQNLLGNNTDVRSTQGTDYGSFLNTVNPDDIESVNVLKGPTAAALYGARGANGVLLITTKKGGKEKGLGLNYNFSDRWNDPYRYVKFQHEYGSGMTETLYSANPSFYKDGNNNDRQFNENDQYGPHSTVPGGDNFYGIIGFPGDGVSWGPKMQGQPLVWWDGVTRPYTANPNIFKSFYRTGNTNTHNVSFSGAGDVGTLRVSYTRTSNDAITYNSNSTQNVFNIGSSINVSKKVKVEATGSYSNISRLNVPNTTGYDLNGNAMPSPGYITMYGLPADYKAIERSLYLNPDGSKNTTLDANAPYPSMGIQDYWWNTFQNNTTFTQNQLLGSIKLTADILPWLNVTGHTGINYYTNQFETKNKPTDAEGLSGGSYSNDLAKITTINLDGLITAHQDNLFNNIDASLSVGGSNYHNKLYDLYASNPGPFLYPFTYNLTNYAGTNPFPKPTENRSETEINSAYGILNLGYKKYLFLELSGRNDWSSTLPAANLSFFYPSANLSFVFTDALKMEAVKKWLSYGKLRFAASESANGTVPYQTIFTYLQPTLGGFTGGLAVPSTLPSLSALLPQKSRSYEIGTDLGFFNNRINLNFTYYNIYSYDQILPVNIATSSGADRLTINTGALRNNGIEFIINANIVNKKNFGWDISVNGAHNQNKVVSIAPGVDQIPIGSWFSGDGVTMNARVGDDYGTIYGYDYQYQNGQKVVNLIKDNNGNVIGSQYATTPDFVKIGNATPKLTGGISNTFHYKNLSLYVLTDFKIGGQIWSADYSSIMGQGEAPETVWERDGHGLPYTFPDGTSANVGVILPGVTSDGKTNTAVVNSWWKYAGNFQSWSNVPLVRSNAIFTNSWGKLREVSLTYRIPQRVVNSTKIIQNLSVSLIGRDLFYLFTTLPDKLNPEGINGTGNAQGIQWAQLPGVRSFGVSVRAGF